VALERDSLAGALGQHAVKELGHLAWWVGEREERAQRHTRRVVMLRVEAAEQVRLSSTHGTRATVHAANAPALRPKRLKFGMGLSMSSNVRGLWNLR
jgi:hypothetical protein